MLAGPNQEGVPGSGPFQVSQKYPASKQRLRGKERLYNTVQHRLGAYLRRCLPT